MILDAVTVRSSPFSPRTTTACVGEARIAVDKGDVVAAELVSDHVDLAVDHVLHAPEQVGAGDVVLDAVALAVDPALAHAGQVEDGLAQRLRRDRARVDADAADHVAAVDDSHAAAKLGRLDGRFLARRSGSDHEQVEVALHGRVIGRTPVRFS
jgi:hypothetical protein